MVYEPSKLEEISILASEADWAWPESLHRIFRPRGVNLLMAQSADQFINIIGSRRIHTAIVDADSEEFNGLVIVKIIRMNYPLLPCIMLTSQARETVLSEALQLDVFSVIGKPVDMSILQRQLNRLFLKMYDSNIFG
jgi:DNA-binding NtrC family response regulator